MTVNLEVRTKRGTEGGSVVLLVDITEIRRLEAVRSDFVANASHELKTPLTVIRAAARNDPRRGPSRRAPATNGSARSRAIRYGCNDWWTTCWIFPATSPGRGAPSGSRSRPIGSLGLAWQELEAEAAPRGVDFEVLGVGEGLGDEAAV